MRFGCGTPKRESASRSSLVTNIVRCDVNTGTPMRANRGDRVLRPRRVASAVHGQVGAAVPAVGFRMIRSNVIYNFALFDLHLYNGDAMVTPRVAASSASCRLTKARAQYQSSCHPESAASAATTAHAHAQPCGCCASSKCVESKERDEGLNESSRPDCSLAGEPSKRCEAEMPSADRIRGICTQDACKCERLRMTPCRARQALTTARPSPPVVPPQPHSSAFQTF